jgi:outer membrane biosynthesis protein TonB
LEDIMSPEQEDRIKQRAYEIWEREGCPDGRGDVHWSMAVQEIRAEDGWVDDAADSDGPTDDLSRQLGSAEAALAPEGATTTAEEPAPAKKSRAKKTAAPKVEATKPAEAAETAEPTEAPKKARKAAASKPAVSAKTSASKTEAKTTAASKEVAEKPKRAAKVKA